MRGLTFHIILIVLLHQGAMFQQVDSNIIEKFHIENVYEYVPFGEANLWQKTSSQSHVQDKVTLRVNPPPRRSWWAFYLYVLAITGLVHAYWRNYRNKIIHRQREAIFRREAHRKIELQRLQEEDKVQTESPSDIRQEFKPPLKWVLSPLEKGSEVQSLPVPPKRVIRSNQENTNRLLSLVNQLVDFSNMETGHTRPHQSQGELLGFVKTHIDQFVEAAARKRLKFHFEPKMVKGNYEFDQNGFGQIIQNLLGDALKFTAPRGQILVRLLLANPQDDGRSILVLEVEATDVGVKKEELSQLFDHLKQNNASMTHKGTGTGLALVRELAELMGGAATVKRQEGKGILFTVTFPIKKVIPSINLENQPPMTFKEMTGSTSV